MTNKRVQYIEGTKSEVIPAPTAGSQYLRRNAGNTGWELVTISPGATSATLSNILANGNTTDGYDIILSSGDAIASADGYVNISGHLSISNGLDLSNKKITSALDPTANQDVATKIYVDNHIIKLTIAAPTDVDKSAAVVGTAITSARADHKHNILTAIAGPIGSVNTEGTANTLARSDHTHAVKDLNFDFQAKGDILYFDGTNWVVLSPSIDGYVLTTHSAGHNPTWSAVPDLSPSIITRPLNNVLYVDNTFSGISTGSINKPYSTITAAINAAVTDTNIILVPGTYSEVLSIPFNKNLKISSISSTSLVECTIVGELTWTFKNGSKLDITGVNLPSGMLLKDGDTGTGDVQLNISNSTFGDIVNGNISSAPYTHNINVDVIGQNFSENSQTNTSSIEVSGDVSVNNCTIGGDITCDGFYVDRIYIADGAIVSSNIYAIVTNSEFGISVTFHFRGTGGELNVDESSNYFAVNNSVALTGTGAHKIILRIGELPAGLQGSVLYFNGTNWAALAPGQDGYVLTAKGVSANPEWDLPTGGSGVGPSAIAAGTQTASSGTISFINSNGISFGMSNSNQITASYTVPTTAGLISAMNFSAGVTSNNMSAIVFSNSNNLSFGLSGSTITASATFAQSVQTQSNIQGISAGTTSQNTGNIIFGNSNGISFGLSNGIITATVNPGAAAGIAANQIGTQTATSGTVVFSNSNGISFGMSNSSVVTASYTVPSTAGLISGINASGGTTSNNLSAIVFSNSNNVSFGLNGSTITATVTIPAQTNQVVGGYAVGNTIGQSSSSTIDARSLSFDGAGAISVGYSGGSVVVSAPVQTSLSFSNLNGLTFGIAGSTLTGSYTVPNQSNQTEGMYAVGNTTGQSSSSTFDARSMSVSGTGNISVGYSGNALIISGSQSNQTANIVVPSAGTQTATSGTVVFSNSNGISFGMSNSSVITASYTVPVQTNQSVGFYALGNTTQNSSTTLDARSISFNGLGAVSVGYSNGSIQISVPNTVSQTVGLYALGNTTQNSSTTLDARSLSFNGLGAATVGYSNGSIQFSAPVVSSLSATGILSISSNGNTISIGVPAQSVNFSAGTTSNNLTNLVFSNSNGLSFGLSGSTITGSYTSPAQTQYSFSNLNGVTFGTAGSTVTASVASQSVQTQSNIQGISAGTTSQNTGNIIFGNSNGISFGLSAGTITATANPGIANQAGTQTATSGTVIFSNSNGISFGMSNSSVITASYTVPSTAGLITGINLSAGTASNNLSAVTFSNSNGLSFGLNGSVITGSYTVPSTAGLLTAINLSAGTTSNNLTNFVFSNSNNLSFGLSGSTITGSIPQISSLSATGAVSISSNGNTISIGAPVQTNFTFSNSNNVSFSTAGSVVVGSASFVQTDQTLRLLAFGNTTNNTTQTVDARSMSFIGLGGNTIGFSNGSIQFSGATTNGLLSAVNISAGTTSNNVTNFVFSNSNNFSFGLSGATITASYNTANPNISFFGLGNTTQNSSTVLNASAISFNGLGDVTVGYSNGSIQISGGGSVKFSAGTTSNNLSAITFSNSNGISFGLNGSTITGSIAAQSAQTANIVVPSAGTQTATSGTVVYSNSNNITFGMSGSSRITASYNFSISGGTSSNFGNGMTFTNSNNMSFTNNAGVIAAKAAPKATEIINDSSVPGTTGADALNNLLLEFPNTNSFTSSTSITIASSAMSQITLLSGANVTITIPTLAASSLKIGCRVVFMLYGAGSSINTITSSGGVTVHLPTVYPTAQYSTFVFECVASDEWVVTSSVSDVWAQNQFSLMRFSRTELNPSISFNFLTAVVPTTTIGSPADRQKTILLTGLNFSGNGSVWSITYDGTFPGGVSVYGSSQNRLVVSAPACDNSGVTFWASPTGSIYWATAIDSSVASGPPGSLGFTHSNWVGFTANHYIIYDPIYAGGNGSIAYATSFSGPWSAYSSPGQIVGMVTNGTGTWVFFSYTSTASQISYSINDGVTLTLAHTFSTGAGAGVNGVWSDQLQKFVAIENFNGAVWTSPDGITWTLYKTVAALANLPYTSFRAQSIAVCGPVIACIINRSLNSQNTVPAGIAYTMDCGIHWYEIYLSGNLGQVTGLISANGRFYFTDGGGIYQSGIITPPNVLYTGV